MLEEKMVYYLVYVSSATQPFSPSELVDLLSKSHAYNSTVGITGMLLYKDGNIMQAIEGEEAAVKSLYAKIQLDKRHRGIITLLQGPQPERQFPNWSMGFNDLKKVDVSSIPGYSEFLNTPLTGAEFSSDPTRCQRLLLSFKQNMA
ncbi:MAG: BLUF domain-containing protein [Candidatus Methylumidiphilus sp.]